MLTSLGPLAVDDTTALVISETSPARRARPGETWDPVKRIGADGIEHLVADEFLRVTQRFVGEHGVLADDDGVLQTAALDQAVTEKLLNLLEETERARVCHVARPGLWVDLGMVILAEIFQVVVA